MMFYDIVFTMLVFSSLNHARRVYVLYLIQMNHSQTNILGSFALPSRLS